MGKSKFFSGQPIFSQVLSLLPKVMIQRACQKHDANRYFKRFMAYDHLVSMLFTAFHRCVSLREVTTIMQVWHNKLRHLGLNHSPRRSTLSDANMSRPVGFFEDIFNGLYRMYYGNLPDSPKHRSLESRLFIMDSTTIELFSEIMKGSVKPSANGKRKGGVKAHMLINAAEDVPSLVLLTSANMNDVELMKKVEVPAKSILVYDRGYINFKHWKKWTEKGIFWVSRMAKHFAYKVELSYEVSERQRSLGVITDQKILLGSANYRAGVQLFARLIEFKDPQTGKIFSFVTNNYQFGAASIAMIYKKRWQVECLFKRLKQNYPLRYFLGDNENAVKIQIMCSLIADLLVKIIKDNVKKRNWAYANLSAILRLHLITYVDLLYFLTDPDKALLKYRDDPPPTHSPSLFSS